MIATAALHACGPSARTDPDGANGVCDSEGTHRCAGLTWQTCTGGNWVDTETCATGCVDATGCTVCQPGTGTCTGEMSHACLPDGSGFYDEYCDPVQGSTCNPNTGVCEGPCALQTLGQTYIGCDYYATQSSQLVNPSFQFAIAVSNTTGAVANVTIEGGALTSPMTIAVPAGAVATQYLPWVPGLKRCMTEAFYECGPPESYGGLVTDGSYHIRSTQPITLYQFSPLDYAYGGKFSFSNDASLLLPTTAWTKNYVGAIWPTWNPMDQGLPFPPMPSNLVVTAAQDGTNVTITTRAATHGGDGAPSFVAGAPQTVALNAGDALQLMSDTGDLTGSVVASDKPVQVLAAHHCTQLPFGYTACDHIEESMFPFEALSNEYIVTAPFLPGSVNGPRQQIVRITAAEPNTMVSVDPPIAGPWTLANVGDFAEVNQRLDDFKVTANNKVIVTQYMEGQDAPPAAGTGDPAMTVAVPIDQYRVSYMFHAPTNYDGGNYVNVTAAMGANIRIDGAPLTTPLIPIGGTGFGVARVPLANTGTGTHTADGDQQFGISVYGYGQYTSYWYPGGLDLKPIIVE